MGRFDNITPGPWRVKKDGDEINVVTHDGRWWICSVGTLPSDDKPRLMADAALIASLPELLALARLGARVAKDVSNSTLRGYPVQVIHGDLMAMGVMNADRSIPAPIAALVRELTEEE